MTTETDWGRVRGGVTLWGEGGEGDSRSGEAENTWAPFFFSRDRVHLAHLLNT
jgi:hypothetical protein